MILETKPNIIDPSLDNKIYLFYGETGTRKTSVAASFKHHIIAATERGYKFINGAMACDIKKWSDMLAFYRDLKNPEVQQKFLTVVIDRADTMYQYCYDYVCASLGIDDPSQKGYGGGWDAIKKEFTRVMQGIESMGYGIVFICHDKDLLDNKMNYVGTKIELKAQAATVIRGLSDFVFNIRKEYDENGNESVFAYSAKLPGVETKHRARYFTDRFEFTYDNLEKEMQKAIDKQIKMEGIEVQIKGREVAKERPFAELQQSVISKLQHLVEISSPKLADVANIVNIQCQGHKVSEVNEQYYDNLLIIETYIYSLEIE